jgi:hypothetical protein
MMGNYLFRVVYKNGEHHEGVALMYAADEADARAIHAEQRSNRIIAVTAMTSGLTPGSSVNGGHTERTSLPAEDVQHEHPK